METIWENAQKFETNWWGDCTSTYAEETKQLLYAEKMRLKAYYDGGRFPVYNMAGKTIMDIGGGPMSILLSCKNFHYAYVVDPGKYPYWVKERYNCKGIDYLRMKGEDLIITEGIDEVWLYNTLQHTDSPQVVVENARALAKKIRMFEWIEIPADEGHPHVLTEKLLSKWLGASGTTEVLAERGCYGKAFYGVFDC